MTKTTGNLVTLPSDEEVAQGLLRFARMVRDHYGDRLVGLYLYGSRARGDHNAESDADVAAVLAGELEFWREICVLSDLSYDELLDHDVLIDAKPVALSAWIDPAAAANPSWIRAIKRDGTPVEVDI